MRARLVRRLECLRRMRLELQRVQLRHSRVHDVRSRLLGDDSDRRPNFRLERRLRRRPRQLIDALLPRQRTRILHLDELAWRVL